MFIGVDDPWSRETSFGGRRLGRRELVVDWLWQFCLEIRIVSWKADDNLSSVLMRLN